MDRMTAALTTSDPYGGTHIANIDIIFGCFGLCVHLLKRLPVEGSFVIVRKWSDSCP